MTPEERAKELHAVFSDGRARLEFPSKGLLRMAVYVEREILKDKLSLVNDLITVYTPGSKRFSLGDLILLQTDLLNELRDLEKNG